MTWEQDSFAYADSYDEAEGRYRGLHHGPRGALSDSDPGLIVRPDVARRQIEAEVVAPEPTVPGADPTYVQKPGEFSEVREPSAGRSPDSTGAA